MFTRVPDLLHATKPVAGVSMMAASGKMRYHLDMTDLMKQALAATDKLSPARQDELARMMLSFAGMAQGLYKLSEEEAAWLDEAENSGLATEEEVAALWTKP